jgi:hypothetical protein
MLAKSALRPRRQNAPRPAWKAIEAYKQWVRGRDCAFASPDCAGKIEAAHMADPASKGMGTKAADNNCVPACAHHHRLHTVKGWSALGITREQGTQMAAEYWKAWPARARWEAENGS